MSKESKTIGVITLQGKALENALKLRGEAAASISVSERYGSSWNTVINKICREHGKMEQNTITKTDQGVQFKLSGYIPDGSVCKHEAKQVLHDMIDLLFKGGEV